MENNKEFILSVFHGDDFYEPLIKSFVDDLPHVLEKIESYKKMGELDLIREYCHQLCGSSATYGYPVLSREFESLENLIKNGNPDEQQIQQKFQSIIDIVHKIERAMI